MACGDNPSEAFVSLGEIRIRLRYVRESTGIGNPLILCEIVDSPEPHEDAEDDLDKVTLVIWPHEAKEIVDELSKALAFVEKLKDWEKEGKS